MSNDVGSPGDEPPRDVGVAVEGEDERAVGRAVAHDVCEEVDAVGRPVANLTGRDGRWRNACRRLEDDLILKPPDEREKTDVEQRRSDGDVRKQTVHAGSRVTARRKGSCGRLRGAI